MYIGVEQLEPESTTCVQQTNSGYIVCSLLLGQESQGLLEALCIFYLRFNGRNFILARTSNLTHAITDCGEDQ